MNNKLLYLNLEKIKSIVLLDEACDPPEYYNWDYSVGEGEIPLVVYEVLEDYDPDYIESPYSKKSYQDFKDNILSIQNTLYGGRDASAPAANSILTLLKDLGYADASAIQTKLDAAVKALKDCQSKGAFVKIYADSSVQTAMDAVSDLDDELNKAAEWIVKQ